MKKNAFTFYQLIMDGHKQTGLVGCCAIDDYFDNHIKKHELTRPDKEEDRKNPCKIWENECRTRVLFLSACF